MQFRYADGTPFPLSTNFLATIRRVVETCAELMRHEHPVDEGWDQTAAPPILSALARALPLADLPETDTGLRWRGGKRDGDGELTLTESTFFRLVVHSRIPVDADTVFHGPFRVREVMQEVEVTLPASGGLFGRRHPKRVTIDRYFVVGVDASRDGDALVLAKRRGGAELRVSLRGAGVASVVDVASGERVVLDGVDKETMSELWNKVCRGMWNRFRRVGSELRGGTLDGHPLDALTEGATLARRLLGAIEPLFAEIQYRGGRPDVLLLHRDRDEERTATLMLALSDLSRLIADLPPRAQAPFRPLGIACDAVPLPYVA